MANWSGSPTWTDKSKINNGNLYDGESKVTAEDINNIFENILYIYIANNFSPKNPINTRNNVKYCLLSYISCGTICSVRMLED